MLGNNPAQQQALVGKLSDIQLQQELRQPSGAAPTYMVMAEIQKRQQMRQGAASAGYSPGATVRQQMLAQMGTLPPVGSPAPSAIPLPNQPPIIPPNMTVQRTPLGFAHGGGIPGYDDGGGVGLGAAMAMPNYFGGIAGQAPVAGPALPAAPAAAPQPAQLAPSNQYGDPAVWTLLGEAGGNPQGQIAVGSTFLNRARMTGANSFGEVATDPRNGYEAWLDSKARQRTMQRYPVGSPQYNQAAGILAGLQAGQIDAMPYVSFYSPTAQAAAGRKMPKWDDGTGVDIAGNRFFTDALSPKFTATSAAAQAGPGQGDPMADAAGTAQQQALLNRLMSEDPSAAHPLSGYLSQVQGQMKDPTAAYANIMNTLQQQVAQQAQQNKAVALMRAGMGMMAARSPNFLTAVGEGGMAGLDSYTQGMQQQRQMQMELANAQLAQATGQNQFQMEAMKQAEAMREADISKGLQQQGIIASVADRLAAENTQRAIWAQRMAGNTNIANIRTAGQEQAATTRANAQTASATTRADAAMADARQRAAAQIMARNPAAWQALGPAGQTALVNQTINGVANTQPTAPGKSGSIGQGVTIHDLNGNVITPGQ